jgi:hypothetical protein
MIERASRGRRRLAAVRIQLLLVIAFIVALEWWLWPVVWISLPFQGRVVDAATGLPVGNAVVVASWRLWTLESPIGTLAVEETATDAAGVFRIPGWGPRWVFGLGHVDRHQPMVWIYAPGYAPQPLANQCCGTGEPGRIIFTKLPAPIELQPAPASGQEQRRLVDDFMWQLSTEFANSPCDFKRVPWMLSLIESARRQLKDVVGGGPFVGVGSRTARCE